MNRHAKGLVGVVVSVGDTSGASGRAYSVPAALHITHEDKPTACLADDVYLAAQANGAGSFVEFVL